MNKSYYNTTKIKDGNQLDLYEGKAKSQELKIEELLRNNPEDWLSSEHINFRVFDNTLPPQSMSRALANLKKKGVIIKSDMTMFVGKYGRPIYGWKYNENFIGGNNNG